MPISLSTMLSGMESNVAKTELCGAVTQGVPPQIHAQDATGFFVLFY
uniref:Uncharacterized protein n=1 Tax=Anguilla anguilla TaxID=7936 RepID=A0A0E9PC41_ANGAN